MAWVRVDDHFDEHPKFSKAGPLGIALWLAGLAYCNRNLTDGFIPWAKARVLLSWDFLGPGTNADGAHQLFTIGVSSGMSGEDVGGDYVADLLCQAGLWTQVDGGYVVHDYLDYQPSKEDVQRERSRNAERQAKHRNAGDNTVNNGRSNGVTNSVSAIVSNAGPVPNPKPVPTPVPGTKPNTGPENPPAPKGASPRGNQKVAALLDAFRINHEYVPMLSGRDHAAIKGCSASPSLIAEAFMAVADREYGDDFMRKRLSVHEAIEWVNGYCEHRLSEPYGRGEELERLLGLGFNPASQRSVRVLP